MKYSEISVVVPCYRESSIIEQSIITLFTYLSRQFARFEIIAVTDGSPDNTAEIIQSLVKERPNIPLRHISFRKNHGKGAAIKQGVLSSRYDPILFIDADLTIPISEIDRFMTALETTDIAIASRLASGTQFEDRTPRYRALLARGFHLCQIAILGNFEYSDTQCGFKLFRRTIALTLFAQSRIKRFAFDAEILFLARKIKASIVALPVTVRKDFRKSNVRIFSDPINMFGALFTIRANDWLGTYHINTK
jgi:glycosyltransferase involved in cell wall biosynthesis